MLSLSLSYVGGGGCCPCHCCLWLGEGSSVAMIAVASNFSILQNILQHMIPVVTCTGKYSKIYLNKIANSTIVLTI